MQKGEILFSENKASEKQDAGLRNVRGHVELIPFEKFKMFCKHRLILILLFFNMDFFFFFYLAHWVASYIIVNNEKSDVSSPVLCSVMGQNSSQAYVIRWSICGTDVRNKKGKRSLFLLFHCQLSTYLMIWFTFYDEFFLTTFIDDFEIIKVSLY